MHPWGRIKSRFAGALATPRFQGYQVRRYCSVGGSGLERAAARGFVLIEVLVALGILSVGIVAVVSSFRGSMNLVSSSENRLRAHLLMQDLLGSLWVRVPQNGTSQGVSEDGLFHWVLEVESWRGEEEAAIHLAGDAAAGNSRTADLVEVTATVQWMERSRMQSIRAVQLQVMPPESRVP